MAATNYDATGNIKPVMLPIERDRITPVKNTVDFSTYSLDAGEGDTLKAVPIPAGVTVLWCTVLPTTDGDGSLPPTNATVDVGDGTDADKFGAGVVLDTAEFNVATSGGVAPTMAPRYFGTAGNVVLTATTDDADVDIDAGRAEVTAYCVKY